MSALNLETPGVYIQELDAFPNSVVPVATAVPAFIGYTPQAEYEGKSYLNKPQKITSMDEFKAFFQYPDPPLPAPPANQYSPQYYLVEQKEQPTSGKYLKLQGSYYSILPDPYTIYYMYNSIRLFYENGGGDAYVVSIGTYGEASGKPTDTPADQIVNSNVKLDDLMSGLALLKNEVEPTMYICPEATLLSPGDNETLMEAMLLQAEGMQTAVCIFDIINGNNPDPILYTNDIENFRSSTGSQGLKYGTAYYPFVGTTIMQDGDLTYENLFGGDVKKLEPLINPPANPNATAKKVLNLIENPPANPMTPQQFHDALSIASKDYKNIMKHILSDANILPPSGGMAGIYTVNDNENGVWHAPANVSMVGVVDLPIKLSADQQAGLNVDAISGKSVNAIRLFNGGLGILVWGARTLDGNSLDWRYVPVRRTVTMLEQSVKVAAHSYVFEPNDMNTWTGVKSMIESFLTSVWKEGGLQGATAEAAFQVQVGLGSTMTAEDILNGIMRVMVKVAVVHPAEFIVITFEQEMATSG